MIENNRNFNLRFYFRALTKIIREPGNFFSNLPADIGLKQPLGFLLVSSLIYAAACLAGNMPLNPVLFGCIFFINAVGMAFIVTGIGYMLMLMFIGKQVPFPFFFQCICIFFRSHTSFFLDSIFFLADRALEMVAYWNRND